MSGLSRLSMCPPRSVWHQSTWLRSLRNAQLSFSSGRKIRRWVWRLETIHIHYSHTHLHYLWLLNVAVYLAMLSVCNIFASCMQELKRTNSGTKATESTPPLEVGPAMLANNNLYLGLLILPSIKGTLDSNQSESDSFCLLSFPPPVLQEGRSTSYNKVKVLWASSKGLSSIYQFIISSAWHLWRSHVFSWVIFSYWGD